MKKLISHFFLRTGLVLFGLCAVCPANASTTPINSIAAIVNNKVITAGQLNQQTALFKSRYHGKPNTLPSNTVLKEQILQQMINQSLQLQLAKRSGITVSSAKLNHALQNIAKENHKTLKQLYKTMESKGFSVADFRQEIRKEILTQTLQGRDVASKVNISQQQINDFLQRNRPLKVQYHIADILIGLPSIPTPAQIQKAKNKAQHLMAQLKKGANFKRLAIANSSAKTALKGGDLGWRKLAELPSVFSTRVVSMNPNSVAGPLRAPNGFHIIKLIAIKHAALPKSRAAQRKQITELLFQQQFRQALITWLAQLRAQAYIKVFPQP
jgi:peptidyl-prolyl cis-trans isomerase SurA